MKYPRTSAALGCLIALMVTACGNKTPTDGLSGVVQGTGASSMKSAQEVWVAQFQTAHPGVTVNYSPDGSGAGRTAFADGAAAFAGSDRALEDAEMAAPSRQCAADTTPINLPVQISTIHIIFNIGGVGELTLSAEVLAKIFTGQITNWADPQIAALNPGIALPGLPITPVHRSDDSGTTESFTGALAQIAPATWTEGPVNRWPTRYGGEAAQGTSGVVAAVQQGTGTIGYADASGVTDAMASARYSPDGIATPVGPTAEAASAVVAASPRLEGRGINDWTLELDRTASGYPFILVSYAIACSRYADSHTGEIVGAYLSQVISEEGQNGAVPQAGNVPLSGELAASIREAAATIR